MNTTGMLLSPRRLVLQGYVHRTSLPSRSRAFSAVLCMSANLEVRRQDVAQLLPIVLLLLFGAGHDRELHRANLLGKNVAFESGLVQLLENSSRYVPREFSVRVQSLEHLRSSDGRLALPPGVVVGYRRNERVSERRMNKDPQLGSLALRARTRSRPPGQASLRAGRSC